MAFTATDIFAIDRAGSNYSASGLDVLTYIRANLGSTDRNAATIAARDALTGLSFGDVVMVDNAVGDVTVSTGWAMYQYLGVGTWRKTAEQESMDVTFTSATNLTYTTGATQGIVVSDTGTDAVIPAVSGANAGLMLPAHKTKVDFLTVTAAFDADAIRTKLGLITVTGAVSLDAINTKLALISVTQAVDLDAMEAAQHVAVTTTGSALTNPIVVTGQSLSFNIGGLSPAP